MNPFEIEQFEARVDALIESYRNLQSEYETLLRAYQAEQQRNQQTRERLNGVIERIRALEAEADNA